MSHEPRTNASSYANLEAELHEAAARYESDHPEIRDALRAVTSADAEVDRAYEAIARNQVVISDWA